MTMKPPANRKELFQRLVDIMRHGSYDMLGAQYHGTGGPGRYLENLLGLPSSNRDIPDTLGWEVKFYSDKTSLITLFHKDPQPAGILRAMVSKFGWKDAQGRLSFRHTITGQSDRFKVVSDANQIMVRPLKKNGFIPYWSHDDILSAAGAKLRRLVLVHGARSGLSVQYDRVDIHENLQLTFFIVEIERGTVRIDFDVREDTPGSKALRNHGTKFRVAPDDVCRLYAKKERLG